MTHRLATTLSIILLGLGCSSASSKHGGDGSADGGDPGKAIDGQVIDVGRQEDARLVTGADLPSLDIPIAHDATDPKDARDAAGPLDGTSAWDADRGLDARDGLGLGVKADALDAPNTRDVSQPGNEVGPETVNIAPGTCASPIEIPWDTAHSSITVSTAGSSHILDFPCASNGHDVVFVIQSRDREVAYADTFGTPWNTALFFTDTCNKPNPPGTPDTAVCNDDACGTQQSQALALLEYGWHYLIVSGVNGASGDVTLHYQHATIGTGDLATLPAGTGVLQGTLSGSDSSGLCMAVGPMNSYWWATCPSGVGGGFRASTCKGASWDTVLIFQVPQLEALSCNDDDSSCGQQSTVSATLAPGAGLFVLTVAAAFADNFGDYSLSYTRP